MTELVKTIVGGLEVWAPPAVDVPDVPGVPQSCSPAQGLVALFAVKGIREADISAAIDSIPDEVQRYTAQIAFGRATAWQRGSATMQALANLVGLTDQDLDDLFAYAAGVLV